MRVLESPAPTYSMVKKKHRLRKQEELNADNSSDEVTMGGTGNAVRGCSHIPKAVNFQSMKKAIKQNVQPLGECTSCGKDSHMIPENEANAASGGVEDYLENMETTIWLCLQCGHQGCDRNSREKHALKHFQTPRSISHAVVLNLASWVVWCYECDDEVQLDSSKRLRECVDFVRKQFGMGRTDSPVTVGKGNNMLTRQGSFTGLDTPIPATEPKPMTPPTPAAVVSVQNLPKVHGLSNLGNTCFFNAVLQNLSQTPELDFLLADHCKKGVVVELPGATDESDSDSGSSSDDGEEMANNTTNPACSPLSVTLLEGGNLTHSLLSFLKDMHSTTKNNVISPSALFGQVCMKTPRFKSFQQQDSHELLRHLLDGLRTEDIKRTQSGILKAFGLPENVNPRKVDEDTKFKVKAYGGRAKRHTFIDSIFGGYLISTVKCQDCGQLSQIFEPFLDLSLPINEEKPGRPNVHMSSNCKKEKQTEKEPESPELPKKGIDGFAYDSSKKSKHMSKKEKKMSRQKKAKRKNRAKNPAMTAERDEEEGDEVHGQDEATPGDKVENAEGDATSEKSENWPSNDENDSDADIEDNLESDASRRRSNTQDNMYAPLMENEEGQSDVDDHEKGDSGKDIAGEIDVDDSSESKSSSDSSEDEIIEYQYSKVDEQDDQGAPLTDETVEQIAQDLENIAIEQEKADCLENGHLNSHCDHTYAASVNDVHTSVNDGENSVNVDSTVNDQENSVKAIDGPVNNIDSSVKAMDSPVNNIDSSVKAIDSSVKDGDCSVKGVDCSVNDVECSVNDECDRSQIDKNDVTMKNCNNSALKAEPEDCAESCDFTKVNGLSVLSGDEDKNSVISDVTVCNNVDCDVKHDGELLGAVGGNSEDLLSVSQQSTPRHTPQRTKTKKEIRKENVRKAMNTLTLRYQPLAHECSVLSCLNQFTAAELLTGNNKFGCETCSKKKHTEKGKQGTMEMVYTNACKQLLIFRPPAILTLHLKRFQQVGYSLRKVNRFVDFPLILDLAPFCSSMAQGVRPKAGIKYSLYGVVEHSGRLTGGHYTAYVKVRPSNGRIHEFLQKHHFKANWDIDVDQLTGEGEEEMSGILPQGKWYYISDTHVKEVHETQVLKSQAYILYYERII